MRGLPGKSPGSLPLGQCPALPPPPESFKFGQVGWRIASLCSSQVHSQTLFGPGDCNPAVSWWLPRKSGHQAVVVTLAGSRSETQSQCLHRPAGWHLVPGPLALRVSGVGCPSGLGRAGDTPWANGARSVPLPSVPLAVLQGSKVTRSDFHLPLV